MRVNITVAFEVVEEIDAGEHSVDLADLEASGMGPGETAGAVVATIQDAAGKARRRVVGEIKARQARPEPSTSVGVDYPLDPEQD
jgi:hypothetical protein